MVNIVYTSWGIANRFPDGTIEINEHLKEFPELHDQILLHELAHTDAPGFTKQDFLLDISPSKVSPWKLFKFICIYPKTFLQFAPIYKRGKTMFYDVNMSIVWGTVITVIGLAIFLGLR